MASDFAELAIEGIDKAIDKGFEPTWDKAAQWKKKRRSTGEPDTSKSRHRESRDSRDSRRNRDLGRHDSSEPSSERRRSWWNVFGGGRKSEEKEREREREREREERQRERERRKDLERQRSHRRTSSSKDRDRARRSSKYYDGDYARRDRQRRDGDRHRDSTRHRRRDSAEGDDRDRYRVSQPDMQNLTRHHTSRDTAPDARRHSRPVYAF